MSRKRITEIFPFLLPIHIFERNLFYQIKMFFDKNKYSKTFEEPLDYEICQTKTKMINEQSGFDIKYQKNKVENLKILSKTMNHVVIKPRETFSFYYLSKKSKKFGKYKEGLVLINGKTVPQIGGGLCHMSNMLYYLFLLTPLTIVERHGHKVKSLPNPDPDSLNGVDATISNGWLDLRVKNETDATYQLDITFDDEYMYGKILGDNPSKEIATIQNDNLKFFRKDSKIYESVSVIRIWENIKNHQKRTEKLYDEIVEVTYPLEENIEIEEMP